MPSAHLQRTRPLALQRGRAPSKPRAGAAGRALAPAPARGAGSTPSVRACPSAPCARPRRGAARAAGEGGGEGPGEGGRTAARRSVGQRLFGWLGGRKQGDDEGDAGQGGQGAAAAAAAAPAAEAGEGAGVAQRTAAATAARQVQPQQAQTRDALEARFIGDTLDETRGGTEERQKQMSLLDQLVPPPPPKEEPVYDFSEPAKAEQAGAAGEGGQQAGATAEGAAASDSAAGSSAARDASSASSSSDESQQDKSNAPLDPDAAVVRGELLDLLSKQLPAADVERIKRSVFSMDTFYVTGTAASSRFRPDVEATVFKGNVRTKDLSKLFEGCQQALMKEFDDKYVLYMVEQQPELDDGASIEEMLMAEEDDDQTRISFVVANRAQVVLETPWWRTLCSVLLLGSTALTSLQLGAATSVAKYPELVKLLSGPDAATSVIPEETLLALLDTSLPIAQGVLAVALAHEFGHRVAAGVHGVELALPLFLPNTQLGTFGAITETKSIIPSRKAQFDIAAAGPAASFAAGGLLFAYGLLTTGSGAPEDLVPVPSQVFQSSLAMGLAARAGLGYPAMHQAQVLVSPELIAGWCALTTAALNVLPVGRIDGGVMAASALGQGTKTFLGFVTYLGLGFGVFARPNVSLLWAIYVLALQRQQMALCMDEVTEAGDVRATAAVSALSVALLVLLPIGPELANELGIGLQQDIFPSDFL